MSREVVRNFGCEKTHLADVESETVAVAFARAYRHPDPSTKALCGVKINEGVIMLEGSVSRCKTCNMLAERQVAAKSQAKVYAEGFEAASDRAGECCGCNTYAEHVINPYDGQPVRTPEETP